MVSCIFLRLWLVFLSGGGCVLLGAVCHVLVAVMCSFIVAAYSYITIICLPEKCNFFHTLTQSEMVKVLDITFKITKVKLNKVIYI